MGTYMTFRFDAKSLRDLMEKNPDYFLFHVGYDLIPYPQDPAGAIVKLTSDAEACQTELALRPGKQGGGGGSLGSVSGCPVPPCTG